MNANLGKGWLILWNYSTSLKSTKSPFLLRFVRLGQISQIYTCKSESTSDFSGALRSVLGVWLMT